MAKGSASPRHGAAVAGALTALSTAVVTGLAAVVGVVIAREFGRTAETDGFFAAYGVFVVLALVASASRVVVLPRLAEARERGVLGSVLGAYALALAAVALPAVVLAEAAPGQLAALLVGESGVARDAAERALRWMVPAAVGQLYAGLAASALAALDDYAAAAAGYALGSVLGLALILLRVDEDGIAAVAWGMALNGAVSFGVPVLALAARRAMVRLTSPAGEVGRPLWDFVRGSSLPLAMQALYVVSLPFAAREGTGELTSFGYAYLCAAALVAVTASSLGLVASVPLTRAAVGAAGVARHVVSSSWLALAVVAGAAGVFALAGGPLFEAVLGDVYGGETGSRLGWLVVALSPWIVASIGFSLAFPLVFVRRRERALPVVAVVAVLLHVPVAWLGATVADLVGLALALAVTTAAVLVVVLVELETLAAVARGLAAAAALVGVAAAVGFGAPALVLGGLASGLAGLVLYATLLGVIRPSGLRDAWAYLRALH